MHGRMRGRTQRELLLCNGLMGMVAYLPLSATHLVSWPCGHAACGFVVARRFFSRATQRCVELHGYDSAIPRCMARLASWPSVNQAELI